MSMRRARPVLLGLFIAGAVAACAGTADRVVQTRPGPKGAIGTDHSGYTDDISRALHDQRRSGVATP